MKYKIKDYISGEILEADNFEAIKEELLNRIEENPCVNVTYNQETYTWEMKSA